MIEIVSGTSARVGQCLYLLLSLSLSALHVGLIRFTEVNKHVVVLVVIQVEVLSVAAVDELLAVG